jgi:hypothetical protein
MRAKSFFVMSVLAVSALTWNAAQAGSAAQAGTPPPRQSGHAATWRPYNLIVDLNNLPQRYSCDDLWYKFHDVLLALGARPDLKILTYRCQRTLPDATARSPRARLQFSLPELLTPAESRWTQLEATTSIVRLAPGHPTSLQTSDCELLRQMKDGLLASVSQRIVNFNLACAAPHTARWPFNVTLQALTPTRAGPGVVAQAGAIPHQK